MSCGTLAGLGLSALGTGVDEYANVQTQNNMNSQVQQEFARQQQFQKQARPIAQANIANSTPQAAANQQQQGSQQYLQAAKASALPQLALPTSQLQQGSNVSGAMTQARNQLGQQANANLQGYGNIGLQQGLGNIGTQSQLGLIGNQAQQWGAILPYQLQQAQQSEQGLSALGSLLGTAGGLVGSYGAMNNGLQPSRTSNYMSYPGTAQMLNGIGQNNSWGGFLSNPNLFSMYGIN